jgi:hypothetical protein
LRDLGAGLTKDAAARGRCCHVQNYEAGRFVPYRHLDALSRLLGRSPSWLLYGHEEADADRVLTRLREQRRQLHVNLERLRELSEQLVDTVSRPSAPNRFAARGVAGGPLPPRLR